MFTVTKKTSLARAALGIGLVALLGGSAVAVAIVSPHTKPSVGHGAGIQFKAQLNQQYCIEVAPGTTQGRALTLSACSSGSSQRWMLTKNADGTNLFADVQGMCVDTAGRKAGDGVAVKVDNCTFGKTQRFRYTAASHLQLNGTTTCLSVPRANSGVAVFLQTCNGASLFQQFRFTI
jgi:Ricin-type beta-trefoil lectin domain